VQYSHSPPPFFLRCVWILEGGGEVNEGDGNGEEWKGGEGTKNIFTLVGFEMKEN